MLSSIRKHARGWLGITLLALIAIPFAFTGVYSYMTGGGAVIVAEVGEREIGQREYANAYQNYRQRLQSLLGASFRPELLDERELRREALERLIEEIVLVDAATDAGYRVSATQLAQRITATEAFQTEGRFDRDLYQARLAQVGRTPEQYEQELRTQLLSEQLLGAVGGTAFVTPGELAELARLELQQRDLLYAVIPPAAPDELPAPEAAELEAFYASHGAEFAEPEQVRLDYLDLSIEALAGESGEPDEATLQRLYTEETARQTGGEERRARHILVELAADADEGARTAALERARALRGRLAEGADFAELARSESADPGSADQGGDLGFFGRGIMDPAFETAAFDLAVGEVSEPVRSAFGYHLIEVLEVSGEALPDFETMRPQLVELYRRQQAEQILFDRVDTLANLAYEHPDSLEPAAEALGLEVRQSPFITREGSDWPLAMPRVLDAAFSPEVLNEGMNSEVIELGDGRMLVLRLGERRPQRQPPLDEVRDAVVARYQQERARTLAAERGAALLERLRGGEALAALAAAEGLDTTSAEGIERGDAAHPVTVVRTGFRLPRPAEGKASVGGVALADGGYALVQLVGVAPGSASSETADEQALRQALERATATAELSAVIAGMRARTPVRIVEENL